VVQVAVAVVQILVDLMLVVQELQDKVTQVGQAIQVVNHLQVVAVVELVL